MDKLLNCPFCGGEAVYESGVEVVPLHDENGAYVDAETFYHEKSGCTICDIWFFINEDEDEGTTINKWNRRAENG